MRDVRRHLSVLRALRLVLSALLRLVGRDADRDEGHPLRRDADDPVALVLQLKKRMTTIVTAHLDEVMAVRPRDADHLPYDADRRTGMVERGESGHTLVEALDGVRLDRHRFIPSLQSVRRRSTWVLPLRLPPLC